MDAVRRRRTEARVRVVLRSGFTLAVEEAAEEQDEPRLFTGDDVVSVLNDRNGVSITYNSESGAVFVILYDGEAITEWHFPEDIGISEATAALEKLAYDLPDAINFADTLITAS